MIPVFADTFYYLAILNPRDASHEAAQALSGLLEVPVVTTAWVLTEVANSFSAPHLRGLFVSLCENLRNDPHVEVVPPSGDLFDEGIALYAQHQDKEWSLIDCISFLVMRRNGMQEALTADHHFEQAGFRALLK